MSLALLQAIKVKNGLPLRIRVLIILLCSNKLKTSIHEAKLCYTKLLVKEFKIYPVNYGVVLIISLEGLQLSIVTQG